MTTSANIIDHQPPWLREYTGMGSTAIHEAGHAAMAFMLGCGISSVTIEVGGMAQAGCGSA